MIDDALDRNCGPLADRRHNQNRVPNRLHSIQLYRVCRFDRIVVF